MTFLVRNISLAFFIIALVTVGAAVYLSSRVLYEAMLNRVFSERIVLVETIGATLLQNPDVSMALVEESIRIGSQNTVGLHSFRLVDGNSRRILASADSSEVGTALDRPLPTTPFNEVQVNVASIKEAEVVDVMYRAPAGVLWMTLDSSYFVSPAIIFAIQHTLVLTVLIGLLGVGFYLLARRYFIRPLRILKQALAGISPESDAARDDNFGGLLESFASIAERVQETLERDRMVSEMKSDFISTTAHQLRTPLSGINWALGALLSDGDKLVPEHKNLIERALEKDKELINLVGTLLNAASIEEGKFGYRRESISLKEIIEKTIEEERQSAEQLKVELVFEVSHETFPEVYADRERIRWVIRNLVENAIRYCHEGGKVVVSLSQDPKQLQVSVKDDGIGISEHDRPYIFQKFYRADAAQKLRNEGSGLGLFIAKNIVNYHGGRIWFDSNEGKGSTFYFTIPVTRRESAVATSINR